VSVVRGILDSDHGTYKDLEKGTVMLIGDAVEHRLVDIEYEANNYSEHLFYLYLYCSRLREYN